MASFNNDSADVGFACGIIQAFYIIRQRLGSHAGIENELIRLMEHAVKKMEGTEQHETFMEDLDRMKRMCL